MAKYTKRKDGRYSTNVDFGYKDDGSRNRIPVYGKTIKELEEKKLHILMMREQGLSVKSSSMLFEEYALRWLSTYKKKAKEVGQWVTAFNLGTFPSPTLILNSEAGQTAPKSACRGDVFADIRRVFSYQTHIFTDGIKSGLLPVNSTCKK